MSDTVTVELTPAKATVVATGAAGPTGVVAANPPATYDLATRTIGVALGTTAGTAAAGDALAAAVAAEAAHVASTTAHSASHVTVAAGAGVTSTDVQAAVAEITGMIQSQEAGDSAAIAAVAAGLASETTRATNAEATKQAHDADLDTIAALDSSTAGALVTDGTGWIRKTYAQLKTALGLVKGDVGLGNVDNTSDANKPVSTAQAAADAATLSSAQTFATSAVGTEASRATTAEAAEAVARAAADGTRLNWRGAWAATTAYAVNDLVTFNGGLFRAPTAFTSGASFVEANWVVLVPQTGTDALTAQNLADLANAATARTNLGLGSVATHAASDYAAVAGSNTFQASQTIHQGYLVLDWSDAGNASAPESHWLGYNGWWGGPAIDVANNPKSQHMVTLYKGNDYYINDAAVTSGSPTLTSATEGNFYASTLAGMAISGPGIPNGTTILSVESKTSLTMSANATATLSAQRVYINRIGVTDLIFTRHGGGGPAAVGIGRTPPSGTHRVEIGSSTIDVAFGNLKLVTGAGQTGKAFAVTDSGNTDRMWITGTDGAPVLSGNHSTYGTGIAVERLILANVSTSNSPLVIKAPTGQATQIALFQLNGVSKTGISQGGLFQWIDSALEATTVGAAGAAAALPATPTKYFLVKDSAGTTLKIPAYS